MSDHEPDCALVQQAKGGNRDAFVRLMKRHANEAYLDCLAEFGRVPDRDDLAQELALRALRALPTLRSPERFGPWLSGIALNICRHWFHRDRKRRPLDDPNDVADPGNNTGEPAVDHTDELRHLMARVQALPEEYRTTLLEYYRQDITYAGLAEQLNVTRATVNFRLCKAREMLRQCLGPTADCPRRDHGLPPSGGPNLRPD